MRSIGISYLVMPLMFLLLCTACKHQEDTTLSTKLYDKNYPYYDRDLERAFPDSVIPVEAYLKAKASISKNMNNESKQNGFDNEWITQGPGNIGARVNTLAIDPTDENTIYGGFSGAGLYKTTDGGINWSPLFEDNASLAMGDIAIDPTDNQKIFLGTGDPNVSGIPSIGNGLFKSEDGGATWVSSGLSDQRIISKVEIDPNNSDVIFVASMGLPFTFNNSRGVFKSVDGGTTWDQVLSISDSTGFTNVIVNPDNSDIVYATSWDRVRSNTVNLVNGAAAGFYRSNDGGNTWSRIENGLPTGLSSRTGMAICANEPNNVYFMNVGTDQQLAGIYHSVDYGENFEAIPIDGLPTNTLGGFGWYFGKLTVDPNDPNRLFILGVNLFETNDLGNTWEMAAPEWWTYIVHADKHDLHVLENGNLYLATDGGIYKEINDTSEMWIDIENIPATQFYRTAYNPHSPNTYYGGAQDNGTTGGNKDDINNWPRIFGGDGFQMVFDPIDPEHYFVETQRGNIRVTTDGGYSYENATSGLEGRRDWDMQYIMSPHNNNILFTGTERAFAAFDSYNVEWVPISDTIVGNVPVANNSPNITTLSESPIVPGVLYYGANDGSVYATQNLGVDWTNVSAGLPIRYVTDIKASPSFESWVYVTHSGYKDNDNESRIHRSKDFGATWEDISANMPDIAVNDILIIPETNDDILFIGTDAGVYGSIDGGLTWQRVGNNMPNIRVYDLDYNIENEELVAATFARSIMSYQISELMEPSSILVNETDFEVSIFPNPTRDFLNISSYLIENNLHIESVNIYDIEGKLVFSNNDKASNSMVQVNVSNLNQGNYYVEIRANSHVVTKQFIKI